MKNITNNFSFWYNNKWNNINNFIKKTLKLDNVQVSLYLFDKNFFIKYNNCVKKIDFNDDDFDKQIYDFIKSQQDKIDLWRN